MYSLLVVQVRKILQVCWKEEQGREKEQRERIGEREEGGRRGRGWGGENRYKGERKKKGTGVRLCANSIVLGRKLDPDHKKRFFSKKKNSG